MQSFLLLLLRAKIWGEYSCIFLFSMRFIKFVEKIADFFIEQVLNSKLRITLLVHVSVTTATIFTAKRTIHKNT